MSRRIWHGYVLGGARLQQLLQRLSPARSRYVHYSWPLRVGTCPCDQDFSNYLRERGIRGRAVFHMGSGGHHLVGRRNHEDGLQNDVLALTLAPREHRAYVRLVVRNSALGRHYKVLFADIHSLGASNLGMFDVISLFHLAEFSDPGSGARRLDDEGVLQLFISRLAPDGLLALYRNSFGFAKLLPLVARAVDRRQLDFVEDFASLAIYRRVNPA